MTYPPNQGRWGKGTKTTHYFDAGDHVAVRGDLADAYRAPPASGKKNPVERFTRDLVYVRPNIVAIFDRIRVARDGHDVVWAAHGAENPVVNGAKNGFYIENGQSRADVTMLAPRSVRLDLRPEPSPSGKGAWYDNTPARSGSKRLEVTHPAGGRDQVFLSILVTGARNDSPPRVQPLGSASGVQGGVIEAIPIGVRAAYLVAFAEDPSGRIAFHAPDSGTHVVAGLTPSGKVRVKATPAENQCRIAIAPVEGTPQGFPPIFATSAGTITYRISRCTLEVHP
jgi:hypothetical protein